MNQVICFSNGCKKPNYGLNYLMYWNDEIWSPYNKDQQWWVCFHNITLYVLKKRQIVNLNFVSCKVHFIWGFWKVFLISFKMFLQVINQFSRIFFLKNIVKTVSLNQINLSVVGPIFICYADKSVYTIISSCLMILQEIERTFRRK